MWKNGLRQVRRVHRLTCLTTSFLSGGSEKEDTPLNKRLEEARTAAHSMHETINDLDIDRLIIVNGGVSPEESIAFAEGMALSSYQFLKYKTGENHKANFLQEIGTI